MKISFCYFINHQFIITIYCDKENQQETIVKKIFNGILRDCTRKTAKKLYMKINIHTPKKTLPSDNIDFGFLLAGLVDSDGHFSKIPELVIFFHENQVFLPYYLRKKIGYGIVSKLKNRRAVRFVISHSLGLERVCDLVHNKLQHLDKIIQYNTLLLSLKGFKLTEKHSFSLKENSWFAGFFLGDGSFQIKIIKKKSFHLPEVRVLIQIEQKTACLLLQIQKHFGGSVERIVSQNTYYYSSVSFDSAKRLIQYFDKHQLMGFKHTQYLLWRKVCLKIQNGYYKKTDLDIQWICNVKKRIHYLDK